MSGTSTIRTERRRYPRSDRSIGEHTLSRPSWVNGPRPVPAARAGRAVPASVIETDRAARRSDELQRLRVLLGEVASVPPALRELNRIMATCDRHVAPSACAEVGCVTLHLGGIDHVDGFVAEIARLDASPARATFEGPGLLPARRLRAFLVQLRRASPSGGSTAR